MLCLIEKNGVQLGFFPLSCIVAEAEHVLGGLLRRQEMEEEIGYKDGEKGR